MAFIYKICTCEAWRAAAEQGLYHGSADDLRDGFIHFSTAEQLAGTLRKHFAAQNGLVLVTLEPSALGDALRWEPARDGALFPHLYGSLDTRLAVAVVDIALRADGSHEIPDATILGATS